MVKSAGKVLGPSSSVKTRTYTLSNSTALSMTGLITEVKLEVDLAQRHGRAAIMLLEDVKLNGTGVWRSMRTNSVRRSSNV